MKPNSVTEEYKLLLTRIGENVAAARIARGITQRELGRISEKNQAMIAKLEKYPPLEMSLRSMYEISRHIPVPLSEVIGKAERDLELFRPLEDSNKLEGRITAILDKLKQLPHNEQMWLTGMIEGLLERTSSPLKLVESTSMISHA